MDDTEQDGFTLEYGRRKITELEKQLAAELKSRLMWQEEAHKVASERDQAQAACAEMRELLRVLYPQVKNWLAGSGEYERIEHSLSTSCGKDYVKLGEQLKPTIELLTRFQQLQGKSLAHWPDLPRELTRLKALVEEANK